MNSLKIAHLTSVHRRYDTRIFIKECQTLAKYYKVYLVVADGKGDERKKGVDFYDIGKPKGRIYRILNTTNKILKKALELDCDIYHLHDPELLRIVTVLKKKGKKVIYDVHENLQQDILTKNWIPFIIRKLVSSISWKYEKYVALKLNLIITATPFIQKKFVTINKNTIDINNYPILSELYDGQVDWSMKKNQICYVGGISKVRGIIKLIASLQFVKSIEQKVLILAGNFVEKSTKKIVKQMPEFNRVQEEGFLERDKVKILLKNSIVGIVNFLSAPNHDDSQPNKIFEYMAAGIPVISSNFRLWKEIIEVNNCGICIDPSNPKKIAEAIQYFLDNKNIAQKMGKNGRCAVENKYNWDCEAHKLLNCYQKLIANKNI